jgi:hypothetical protein
MKVCFNKINDSAQLKEMLLRNNWPDELIREPLDTFQQVGVVILESRDDDDDEAILTLCYQPEKLASQPPCLEFVHPGVDIVGLDTLPLWRSL